LNDDIFRIPTRSFHLITFIVSLLIAVYEGYSMKGFDRIKAFFETKEHVPDMPPEGAYNYRTLDIEEITTLRGCSIYFQCKYAP
jgi:hypothetical protein